MSVTNPSMKPFGRTQGSLRTGGMAKALIDIHNALPQASADVMAAMPEDDNEYEYLMEQYSNLLVTLWSVLHRFDNVDLEALAEGDPAA